MAVVFGKWVPQVERKLVNVCLVCSYDQGRIKNHAQANSEHRRLRPYHNELAMAIIDQVGSDQLYGPDDFPILHAACRLGNDERIAHRRYYTVFIVLNDRDFQWEQKLNKFGYHYYYFQHVFGTRAQYSLYYFQHQVEIKLCRHDWKYNGHAYSNNYWICRSCKQRKAASIRWRPGGQQSLEEYFT